MNALILNVVRQPLPPSFLAGKAWMMIRRSWTDGLNMVTSLTIQTSLYVYWFLLEQITDPIFQPLVSRAKDLGIDIVIGYGEKTDDSHYYNTCSYIHAGKEVSKYRKVHLPGNKEPYPDPEFIDQLEKRYFEPGDYGFKVCEL